MGLLDREPKLTDFGHERREGIDGGLTWHLRHGRRRPGDEEKRDEAGEACLKHHEIPP